MWASTLWNDPTPALQWAVVIVAGLVGAMTDMSSRRLPNWLTGPLLLGGLAHALLVGSWAGVFDALGACVLLAIPYVLLFVFAGGGAGDAKMMGAIGAWLGVINGLAALACVALCGVIMAMIFAAMRGRARQVVANVSGMAYGVVCTLASRGKVGDSLRSGSPTEPMLTMPYGLAIFVGVCISAAGVWLWRN